jgi:hypothetical protein
VIRSAVLSRITFFNNSVRSDTAFALGKVAEYGELQIEIIPTKLMRM